MAGFDRRTAFLVPALVALACASGQSLDEGDASAIGASSRGGTAHGGASGSGAMQGVTSGGASASAGGNGAGATASSSGSVSGDASPTDAQRAGDAASEATRSDGGRGGGGAGTGSGGTGGNPSAGGAGTGGAATGGSAGTGGSPNAPTFGGVYAGPGPKCTATGCYTGNPAAAAACACPSGFTASAGMKLLDDRACPNDNPPYGWSSFYVCYGGTWSDSADFGGFYFNDGTTCAVGNPFSSGACACPTGTQAIDMVVDGACWNDEHIVLCWNPTAQRRTFAGAYEMSDSTSLGTNGCVTSNPASGGCSCPTGSTAIQVRSIYGPGNAGCKSNGAYGGHLYVCAVN